MPASAISFGQGISMTALQLANFWQDVAVDWTKERIYLPLEDLAHFDVTEAQIAEHRGGQKGQWRGELAAPGGGHFGSVDADQFRAHGDLRRYWWARCTR